MRQPFARRGEVCARERRRYEIADVLRVINALEGNADDAIGRIKGWATTVAAVDGRVNLDDQQGAWQHARRRAEPVVLGLDARYDALSDGQPGATEWVASHRDARS